MSIITFWNGTKEQIGNSSSSLALATFIAIEHNIKVLFISTSFNDEIVNSAFWAPEKKSNFGIFGMNTRDIFSEQGGIQELERIARSNKITANTITNYTKVVLRERLEILPGLTNATGREYDELKPKYANIIALASQYYDMVIVDLDRRIGPDSEKILKLSNVVIAMMPQRKSEIESINNLLKREDILNNRNTIMTIGKYMEDTKYNAKNITRSILKRKELVNTIPYNNLFFEASQEGKVIDLFLSLMRIKQEDQNSKFISEIKRLYDGIKEKLSEANQII